MGNCCTSGKQNKYTVKQQKKQPQEPQVKEEDMYESEQSMTTSRYNYIKQKQAKALIDEMLDVEGIQQNESIIIMPNNTNSQSTKDFSR